MGDSNLTELEAQVAAQGLALQESKALLKQERASQKRQERAEKTKARAEFKKQEAKKAKLHKKLTKLIAQGKTVEGYEKNLKLFAFAQYEEGATKLASPTFFVASRYIPHRVWKDLQEHPALFSQVQEELVQKFGNPCKEAPRFDIQAVFGEFPEVCAKLVEDIAGLYKSNQSWPEALADNNIRSKRLPTSTDPSAHPPKILHTRSDLPGLSPGSRATTQNACSHHAIDPGSEPSPKGWTTGTAQESFRGTQTNYDPGLKRRRINQPGHYSCTDTLLPFHYAQPHNSFQNGFANAITPATGSDHPSQPSSGGYTVSGYPTILPQTSTSLGQYSNGLQRSRINETGLPESHAPSITRTSPCNYRGLPSASCLVNIRAVQSTANESIPLRLDPHTPSPSKALMIPEELLYHTNVYFKTLCQKMKFDKDGNLLTSTGTKWDNSLCSDFDSHCFTATILARQNLNYFPALTKACALVTKIIRAEHPRTLACFLEVLIHLNQTGHSALASYLGGFIGRMSQTITIQAHPWGQICRLLGQPDLDSEAMSRIWQCTIDTFGDELGPMSRLAVSVRLDYIKRVETDHTNEEKLLRQLLDRLRNTNLSTPELSTLRVMLNLAHNLRKQGKHEEAERTARDVLSLLGQHQIYACRTVERIESLKVVSHSQFDGGKVEAAAQTIEEAIQMIKDHLGNEHPWVTEFKTVLEGWLRAANKIEDADRLQEEIYELMEKDSNEHLPENSTDE